MKKVVILPGVGLHENTEDHYAFVKHFRKAGLEAEIFWWAHDWPIPLLDKSSGVHFRGFREWVYEVILDFQQVVLHAFDMDLPEADWYVGHSAGSILALAQKDVPAVVFGSPAVLLESLGKSENLKVEASIREEMTRRNSKKSIYNVINIHDILSYPLNYSGVENYSYSGPWWLPSSFNPIKAHHDYWENKKIINRMIDKVSAL